MIIGTASCSNLPVKAVDMQAATLPGRPNYEIQSIICFIPFIKSESYICAVIAEGRVSEFEVPFFRLKQGGLRYLPYAFTENGVATADIHRLHR